MIRDNGIGIYCKQSAYPHLHENNIVANRELALDLGPKQSVQISRMGPFREKSGEFMSEGMPGAKFFQKNKQKGFALRFPEDGRIDARDNWWGDSARVELTAKGGEGNLVFVEDAHDQPEAEFGGKKYPRDRFVYAPWALGPISDAGPTAPAHPVGVIRSVTSAP